jgi:predicted NAD/FAD-binding protein
VPSRATEMSMSIHCGGCGLEYAGARGVGGVLAQPRSLARPQFVRMLGSIRRFHRLAHQAVAAGDVGMTLRSFLVAHRFSPYFVRHYVVPVVSSVWSAGSADALAYPAHHLFTFLDNHGMLSVTGSPAWRTVVGGSRAYVERIAKGLGAVETSTPVRAIVRQATGIEIRDDADRAVLFDRVVVATHADTALSLVERPTRDERVVLGAFRYSRNETWLHTDDRVLPRSPRARASWNYLLPGCGADSRQVLVSYDMNRLQALPSRIPYVVTLNAMDRIDPAKVVARMTYEHPIFSSESVAAQAGLARLNSGTLAYAGAYHGWGFHEDGCRAGLAAAASLGAR